MGPAMKLADLAQTEKCLGAGLCILGPMQHKSRCEIAIGLKSLLPLYLQQHAAKRQSEIEAAPPKAAPFNH